MLDKSPGMWYNTIVHLAQCPQTAPFNTPCEQQKPQKEKEKMKISTVKLQSMMNKVIKGVGNNKLIPITSLIGITAEDGTLTIVSTDDTNYLYVSEVLDNEKEEF